MWDDVIIGDGHKGFSSRKVFKIDGDHGIAENSVSYWIDGCILGGGMTIFKDTDTGEDLKSKIDNKVPLKTIQNFLDDTFLSHAKPSVLKRLIKKSIKESFESGKEKKQKEILNALGIR